MIGYVSGKVKYIKDGVVLLENNGIGYEITCSASAVNKLNIDREGGVYTYLAVREDAISLYGFISIEEKDMFLNLITVSGVGPKMAIGILSNMDLQSLAFKIASSDIKGLSQVKGLGKKTAERIILELREKIGAIDSDGVITVKEQAVEVDNDAVIALMSLGFNKSESIKVLTEGAKQGVKGLENLISYALKNIR